MCSPEEIYADSDNGPPVPVAHSALSRPPLPMRSPSRPRYPAGPRCRIVRPAMPRPRGARSSSSLGPARQVNRKLGAPWGPPAAACAAPPKAGARTPGHVSRNVPAGGLAFGPCQASGLLSHARLRLVRSHGAERRKAARLALKVRAPGAWCHGPVTRGHGHGAGIVNPIPKRKVAAHGS